MAQPPGGPAKGLIDKVASAKVDSALDDPDGDGVDEHGNELLGEVVDDKDATAATIAQATGLDLGLISRLLPSAATVTAGAMKKEGAFDHVLNIHAQVAAKVQAAIDAAKKKS